MLRPTAQTNVCAQCSITLTSADSDVSLNAGLTPMIILAHQASNVRLLHLLANSQPAVTRVFRQVQDAL